MAVYDNDGSGRSAGVVSDSWLGFFVKTGLKALFWAGVWVVFPLAGVVGGGVVLARALLTGGSRAIGESGFYRYLMSRLSDRRERKENRASARVLIRNEAQAVRRSGGLFKADGTFNPRVPLPDGTKVVSSGQGKVVLSIGGVERLVTRDGEKWTMRFASADEGRLFLDHVSARGYDGFVRDADGREGKDWEEEDGKGCAVVSDSLDVLSRCASEFFADRPARYVSVGDGASLAARVYRLGEFSPDVSKTRVILRFDSEESMLGALRGDTSMKGLVAVVDNDLSEVTSPWYLTLPANAETMKCLSYDGEKLRDARTENNIGNLSDSDLSLTLMMHDIREQGYSLSVISRDLDLSEAEVCGVKAGDYALMKEASALFVGRRGVGLGLGDDRGVKDGGLEARVFESCYMKDLARIKNVRREFDPAAGILRVRWDYDGADGEVVSGASSKVLDDTELARYLSREKAPSEAEMKAVAVRQMGLDGQSLAYAYAASKLGGEAKGNILGVSPVYDLLVPDHDTIDSLRLRSEMEKAYRKGAAEETERMDASRRESVRGTLGRESGEADVIVDGTHHGIRCDVTEEEGVVRKVETRVESPGFVGKSVETEYLSPGEDDGRERTARRRGPRL